MKRLIMIAVCVAYVSMSAIAFAADVYVTKNGKKYHNENCLRIKNRETVKIDEAQAIKDGYSPCNKCHKDNSSANKVSLPVKK